MKIYLAHPFGTAELIREWQKEHENDWDVTMINPFFDLEQAHFPKLKAGLISKGDVPLSVVQGDIDIIPVCHAMIVYLDGSPTHGTIMEIVYAYFSGVDILIVTTDGNEGHPWLRYHATKIFCSLEELEEYMPEWVEKMRTPKVNE